MQKKAIFISLTVLAAASVVYFFCFSSNRPLTKKAPAASDTIVPCIYKYNGVPVPVPKPVGYTNDFAGIFSAAQKLQLDSLIKQHENKTTNQFAIVTFDTITIPEEKFDAYTLKLARCWGVGQKGKNNGVVIAFCFRMHKIRIQNGYGIEKIISDSTVKKIVDEKMLPKYKEQDYFGGTLAGMKEMMGRLEE